MTYNKQAYNITKCSNSRDLDFYKNEPLVARQHSLSGETSRSESNLVTSPPNHRRTNEIKGLTAGANPSRCGETAGYFTPVRRSSRSLLSGRKERATHARESGTPRANVLHTSCKDFHFTPLHTEKSSFWN
jgi:hypothetical protein